MKIYNINTIIYNIDNILIQYYKHQCLRRNNEKYILNLVLFINNIIIRGSFIPYSEVHCSILVFNTCVYSQV